jgi:hypothetical protein
MKSLFENVASVHRKKFSIKSIIHCFIYKQEYKEVKYKIFLEDFIILNRHNLLT